MYALRLFLRALMRSATRTRSAKTHATAMMMPVAPLTASSLPPAASSETTLELVTVVVMVV